MKPFPIRCAVGAVPVLLAGLLIGLNAAPANDADALRPAITVANLDPAACASYRGATRQPVEPDMVAAVLGQHPKLKPQWEAPRRIEGKAEPVHFVIAFKQETLIGTAFVQEGFTFRTLKPGIADAPDPANEQQWESPTIPASQGGGSLIPLPNAAKTRAVLLTAPAGDGQRSQLRAVRLHSERLLNAVPFALAYADREYRPPNTPFNPWPASHITSGKGHWVSAGKDNSGFVPVPALSDISPSWFLLSWQTEQVIEGLWLRSNIEKLDVSAFVGPESVNPRAGIADEWRKIKDATETVVEMQDQHENARWVKFPQPVRTRGLRLTLLRSADGPVATFKGLQVFTKLGDRAVPASPSSGEGDAVPPFRVPYQLAEDANVTMVVNTPDGKRVKNLFARQERKPGKYDAGWDLKDNDGNFVQPGTYKWTALAGPDLKLKYEMTAYPNVESHAPENSPWLNGADGPGGWMADHTPPSSVCAAGDKVFLGSQVSESGVSLIEVDTDGKKKWGHHSFAAWTGSRFLASDGKEVFSGMAILGSPTDGVWGIDLATHKVRNVFTLPPTASRQRGMQGLAARDGKLYVSVRGGEAWLTGAAAGEDVDLLACQPLYAEKRKPRVAYEVVPDPQGDFVRLFRLAGTPPGGATSHTLAYLETMSSKRSQQHIVLSFKKPVPIGSVVYPPPSDGDVKLTLSTLKPNAPYPPNPDDANQWVPFQAEAKQAWDAVPAPPNTTTRALRLTFTRGGKAGGDDPFAKLTETPKNPKDDFPDLDKPKTGAQAALEFGSDKSTWRGRVEGMRLLRRRYENVAGTAAVKVSSGKVAADGTWDANRTAPLTESDPGVYMLEWKAEQSLRGLAVKEIDGELTKVDAFTGTGTPSLTGDGWQQVAEYRTARREYYQGDNQNNLARYLDGNIDFGKEVKTKAVRLRVVKQWADGGGQGTLGVRQDHGERKIDPTRCRIFGVAALKYVGGEPAVEATTAERIDTHDIATGKVTAEVPIEKPGEIAIDPTGNLFAISGTKIVRVDLKSGTHTPFVTDLESPTDFAFDKESRLYVFDGGKERQNVRVYDSSGKYVRSIGTPGGFKVGPWDATRMGQVTALDIDARGQLWVVETQYHPKRITVWNPDGSFRKELLGNTPYGGGGVLDPNDKTRLFYGTLEFELDWKTGLSRIKHLHYLGDAPPGERPMLVNGRTYLVNRPYIHTMQCGVVYRYENGVAKPAAAMGQAAAFEPLKHPDVSVKFGGKALTEHRFLWCDRNGDGNVQAEEVTLTPKGTFHSITNFNLDLSAQGRDIRYEVSEFLPNGVPVYVEKPTPQLKGQYLYRLNNGNYYRMGSGTTHEAVLRPDGTAVSDYAQEGEPGVQAITSAKPYTRDQVVAQFMIVGHENAGPDIGELVVINSNTGAWQVWSGDGLLIGPIFRDFRGGQSRPWSMREHARGMVFDDLTAGQEHFSGYFCKTTADGKFYVVAGHNHASVLEVLGLDKYKRLGGEVTVTAEDLAKAREWESRREKASVYARAPVLDIHKLLKPPALDGKLAGFGPVAAQFEGTDRGEGAELYAGYDDKHLYLAYQVRKMGPLKNAGREFERLFKTGAAVDLHLETDAKADPTRQAPVAGDVRLLITTAPDGPKAVLYRPVVPGTPPGKAMRVVSPVAEVTIDEVKLLDGVRFARHAEGDRYVVEAAIPLAAIGLKAAPGLRVKLDWGVLVSGPDGTEVIRRVYWANQAAQIVADAPSEARLHPHLWGYAVFHGPRGDDTRLDTVIGGKKPDKDVGDILDDLNTTPKKK